MEKFLAIVKHEYKKVVVKWSFIIGTFIIPLLSFALLVIVPALIFSSKSEPTRIVIVDQTNKIATRIKENLSDSKAEQPQNNNEAQNLNTQEEQFKRSAKQLSGDYNFVNYNAAAKSIEQIKRELNGKITNKEIDAYLIIPSNYESREAKFELFSRKAGDILSSSVLERAVNSAVRSQRLADADIQEDKLDDLTRNIDFSKTTISELGNEKDSGSSFIASFVSGFILYMMLILYGQQIMAAVIEEKETRIAEILFSSAKPFQLMFGKLVGVGLAGLTQLAIWAIAAVALVGFSVAQMSAMGISFEIPDITTLTIVYFFVYFLLGFFIYATIYALIGSMVTTLQEGSQFATAPIILLILAFYLSFAVIRDPNSSVSFWVSIVPFFAPITMPVRILAETPPFWQIALSIALNGLAIAGLVWLAARVYRVGMLMTGKRATIPEVWKWVRRK